MAITSIKTGSSFTNLIKYNDFVAGYPPLMAAPTATDGETGTTVSAAFTAVSGATSYTVLSTPGSLTGTGSSSPITVSGLTAGTAYTFQVSATNSVGTGPYSAASNSVTPAVPTSYDSIASVAASGSSVSLNSIPNTYKHLQIRGINFYTGADYRFNYIQANGDTGANYSNHWLLGDANGGVYASGQASANYVRYWNSLVNSSTNYGIAFIIDILDYASTSKYKTFRIYAGQNDNNVDNAGLVYLGSGLWQSTSAINSLTFTTTSGSWSSSKSQFALYGIKG